LIDWLIDWLTDRLIDWQTDWLIDWYIMNFSWWKIYIVREYIQFVLREGRALWCLKFDILMLRSEKIMSKIIAKISKKLFNQLNVINWKLKQLILQHLIATFIKFTSILQCSTKFRIIFPNKIQYQTGNIDHPKIKSKYSIINKLIFEGQPCMNEKFHKLLKFLHFKSQQKCYFFTTLDFKLSCLKAQNYSTRNKVIFQCFVEQKTAVEYEDYQLRMSLRLTMYVLSKFT